MQPIDIFILLLCLVWLLGSLFFLRRRKKRGGGCCGCHGCQAHAPKKEAGPPPAAPTCNGHCAHCSACRRDD